MTVSISPVYLAYGPGTSIRAEFGGYEGNTTALSWYRRGGAFVPLTQGDAGYGQPVQYGPISMGTFRNQRKAFVMNEEIRGHYGNYDLRSRAINAFGWDGVTPLIATVTIFGGVIVWASATNIYAFDVGGNYPAGSVITIVNHGHIIGKGGRGGDGGAVNHPGSNQYATNGANGESGGNALHIGYPGDGAQTIIHNHAVIGGGGGGGGGAASEMTYRYSSSGSGGEDSSSSLNYFGGPGGGGGGGAGGNPDDPNGGGGAGGTMGGFGSAFSPFYTGISGIGDHPVTGTPMSNAFDGTNGIWNAPGAGSGRSYIHNYYGAGVAAQGGGLGSPGQAPQQPKTDSSQTSGYSPDISRANYFYLGYGLNGASGPGGQATQGAGYASWPLGYGTTYGAIG